jgi:hypothetical protein
VRRFRRFNCVLPFLVEAGTDVFVQPAGRSSLVFAHVRAASVGSSVTEANCHPFAFSRYLFMHNGCDVRDDACLAVFPHCRVLPHRYLAEFPRLRRRMLNFMSQTVFDSIRGTCDSEHVYGSFRHTRCHVHVSRFEVDCSFADSGCSSLSLARNRRRFVNSCPLTRYGIVLLKLLSCCERGRRASLVRRRSSIAVDAQTLLWFPQRGRHY